MRVSMATDPGSRDVPNEDWCGATPSVIVVLDGVTSMGGANGCSHGTPWYVRQLGSWLLTAEPGVPLDVILAGAIFDVADLHRGCDLASAGAPSAAVGMLRFDSIRAEYLVLADVTVALKTAEGIKVITDDRVAASVAGVDPSAPDVAGEITARRAADRNRPGGYWVAAADPEAAAHAVTGSAAGVLRAMVMTDGASRIADMFGTAWADVMASGPGDLIAQVRLCESRDPDRHRHPRFKVSDDATSALWIAGR
jgi:hypothetical protein